MGKFICHTCSTEQEKDNYCKRCGLLQTSCPFCSEPTDRLANFCGQCGKDLRGLHGQGEFLPYPIETSDAIQAKTLERLGIDRQHE